MSDAITAAAPPPAPLIGQVPCNGCRRCCIGDAIRLLPTDEPAEYQTVPHDWMPGQRMLAHKPNGECVYLTESGCAAVCDAKAMQSAHYDLATDASAQCECAAAIRALDAK